MKPEPGASILVVDDDEVFRSRLVRALSDRGYVARAVGDGDEALRAAEAESPELAVVDLRMPNVGGLETVRGLLAIDSTTRIVVLTGYGSIATAVEALRLGAVDYLQKPADTDQILTALARAEGANVAQELDASAEVPSLARVEWEHIQRVLSDCAGNVSQAAKLLGIHRRSLQRKLGKFPVRR